MLRQLLQRQLFYSTPLPLSHRPLTILNHDITPGTSVQLSMDIARLPTRTHVEVPVFVNRAKREGPIILLLAGLHGDEINGIEILRRLIRENYHRPQRGTIICIPIMNIFGFISQSREVPDGRDLNRVFPGSPNGSLASRIAYTLLNEVVRHVDYALDFHTGGASRSNYPQVRSVLEDEQSLELAQAFNPPFILASKYLDKSLRKTAHSIGKSILLYEGGESLRLDEFSVQEGLQGALRVLHYLGMRDNDAPTDRSPVIIKKSTWVRAKTSGMFLATISNGAHVQKGAILGTVMDPYGEFERKVRAPTEGYVICINNHPLINQGEALIHLGYYP